MHCMTVSLAQGGEGLGAMWGLQKTLEYLEKAGFARVFGSLDNLLKGAASQAVQNLNRMLGWDETMGILP